MKKEVLKMASATEPFKWGAYWMRSLMQTLTEVSFGNKKCRVIIEYDPTSERVRIFKEEDQEG